MKILLNLLCTPLKFFNPFLILETVNPTVIDNAAAATESFSLSGTVMEAWDKVVAWVKGLFAWGKTTGATEEGGWSLLTFVDGVWTKVKEWFTGIFSWASTEKEGDSWVVKTAKNVLKGVKEWFGSMFKFDSASDLLSTGLNIMIKVQKIERFIMM